MTQHHGRAGADEDGYPCDHSKRRKQAAPDAPSRTQEAQEPDFQIAMPPPPPKASGKHWQQYRGTRLTKSRSFRSFGEFDGFPNRSGRCEAGLCWMFLRTEADQYLAVLIEPMLHAFLNDIVIIAEAARRERPIPACV